MNKNISTIMFYLFAILIVIACFLAIGFFTKREIVKTSVKIGASPENCYTVYNDPDVMGVWTENFKALELVDGVPNSVGAKYELILEDPNGEEESVLHEEMIEVEPNKMQVMSYSNEYLDGTITTTFNTEGDSTVLTSINKYTGKTVLLRSVFHFMKDKVTGNTDLQYQKLKKLIEDRYSIKNVIPVRDSLSTESSGVSTNTEVDTIN